MESDNNILKCAENAYHISCVVRAFLKYYDDIDELQALLPVALMLHREIDTLYAELIDA